MTKTRRPNLVINNTQLEHKENNKIIIDIDIVEKHRYSKIYLNFGCMCAKVKLLINLFKLLSFNNKLILFLRSVEAKKEK